MCKIFVNADPQLYSLRPRSLRLHGAVTSLRLEALYWQVLEDIAQRDGMRLNELITRLHDEVVQAHGAVDNFTSFLRVSCMRYLSLQLAGGIPADPGVAIRSLDADAVLALEQQRARPLPAG